MFRASLTKIIAQKTPLRCAGACLRSSSSSATAAPLAKAPEKLEVFIDDKPVMVDPGTTILQVYMSILY